MEVNESSTGCLLFVSNCCERIIDKKLVNANRFYVSIPRFYHFSIFPPQNHKLMMTAIVLDMVNVAGFFS